MQLTEITVKSFKGIKTATLPLRDTTVLVGPNNAGKSSALQAIHFAARAMAQAAEANKQTTLSISDLEYIPTNSYKELGHNATWGNQQGSAESEVVFTFLDDNGNKNQARVILKSARNEGLSVDPTIPPSLLTEFRGKDRVFSAYIPGIAGIPLDEQRLTRRHIYRKVASGDSNVVLRNILLRIKEEGKIELLEKYVSGVYPVTHFYVSFSEQTDLYIHAEFTTLGKARRPLEFAGTGFLHVVQLFSYLVLFQPRVLLIDEPESHLHPTLQTKLTRELRKRAAEIGSKALITTHSPFVARGLPLGSGVVLVKAGGVTESKESELIKRALGWGALDKPILLCTEDRNANELSEILRQEPDLDNIVSVFPFNGVDGLGHAPVMAELKQKLGGNHKVIVHRDRDGRSDAEVKTWRDAYLNHGITPWVTAGSDIEMYFCSAGYLSCLYNLPFVEADQAITDILNAENEKFTAEFSEKRKQINRMYEKTGGSPATDDLIAKWHWSQWVRGKTLISRIRDWARTEGYDEKLIGRAKEEVVVATDLMKTIADQM
ncbi:ATP-dependent nuclease [Sphingomonas sp. ASY06-1R]|uniref:ATP-dependent nuclease n=1 Tax=Sphingomonas sp. ASY06-1R TaxID=3445771 RepID=UPI003FA1AA5F